MTIRWHKLDKKQRSTAGNYDFDANIMRRLMRGLSCCHVAFSGPPATGRLMHLVQTMILNFF